MKQANWLALVLVAAMHLGCQKQQSGKSLPPASETAAFASSSPASAEAAVQTADASAPAPTASTLAQPINRLLVYHAEVRIKATDMARATVRLDSLVRQSGSVVSASTETREDGQWRQETTLRVLPQRFQQVLRGLKSLGTLEENKLSTDDVTAEHADVTARLAAKRAIEHQYTTLLSKAQKIKDILDIQEKLGEVREEIEATESRLKALNDEVAFSTITLTIYQPLALTTPDAPIVSFGSRLVESFYNGWEVLVGLLLGGISLWPLVLLAGTGAWWWARRRTQRQQARLATKPTGQPVSAPPAA